MHACIPLRQLEIPTLMSDTGQYQRQEHILNATKGENLITISILIITVHIATDGMQYATADFPIIITVIIMSVFLEHLSV